MKLNELKQIQKDLAKSIKEAKGTRKKFKDGYVYNLKHLSYTYRHQHIAYCLARGRKMEDIERTHRSDNYPCKNEYEYILSNIEIPEREPFIKEVSCE